MRFLHLIRPVMCVLPEVASPDRKVCAVNDFRGEDLQHFHEHRTFDKDP